MGEKNKLYNVPIVFVVTFGESHVSPLKSWSSTLFAVLSSPFICKRTGCHVPFYDDKVKTQTLWQPVLSTIHKNHYRLNSEMLLGVFVKPL